MEQHLPLETTTDDGSGRKRRRGGEAARARQEAAREAAARAEEEEGSVGKTQTVWQWLEVETFRLFDEKMVQERAQRKADAQKWCS